MEYNFEWDIEKAKRNIKKHRVKFEDVATVLNDPRAVSIYDKDHSENEERWVTMGLSFNGILLIVHHTYKQVDNMTAVIRIISSRKATKHEEKQYEEVLK